MTTMPVPGTVRTFASLVKLSHSVFALPFALTALLVATGGAPRPGTLALVVVAVVAARTAAMAYNRFADRFVDAANPRTAGREIPRGEVRPGAALALVAGASALFLAACALLSPLCLWLGVPTLAWLLAYSHCKHFTWLSHLWLGVALGIAPVAAWVAAEGAFTARTPIAVLLGAAVVVWVAGFDVMYACQDEEFDRRTGLHSVPARFGARTALVLARGLHVVALVGFVLFGRAVPLGPAWLVGCALAAGLLVWQHRLLAPGDLARIHMAFFTANGAIAILMFVAACVDLWILV